MPERGEPAEASGSVTGAPTARTPFPIFAAALALVLALGIGLRLANLGNVARRTPDEVTYTSQAKRVLAEGDARTPAPGPISRARQASAPCCCSR